MLCNSSRGAFQSPRARARHGDDVDLSFGSRSAGRDPRDHENRPPGHVGMFGCRLNGGILFFCGPTSIGKGETHSRKPEKVMPLLRMSRARLALQLCVDERDFFFLLCA